MSASTPNLDDWLASPSARIAARMGPTTAVVYLNGTRRWFQALGRPWTEYPRLAGAANRGLADLLFEHGVHTLIEPLFGHDLLSRGPDYVELALGPSLAVFADEEHRRWYRDRQLRVAFYGDWEATLERLGFAAVAKQLRAVASTTAEHAGPRLLVGLFADENLARLHTLARSLPDASSWLRAYYGVEPGPVDLVIGSGQPALWDIPLLDINKASLYFLQAPSFELDRPTLRRILFDHLFERRNDDELGDVQAQPGAAELRVLGCGRRGPHGWRAS